MIVNYPRKNNKNNGETWLLNKSFIFPPPGFTISFVSNGTLFSSIHAEESGWTNQLYYDNVKIAEGSGVFSGGMQISDWIDANYRAVKFLKAPTGDLLAWLQSNAVKQ